MFLGFCDLPLSQSQAPVAQQQIQSVHAIALGGEQHNPRHNSGGVSEDQDHECPSRDVTDVDTRCAA